MAAKKRAKRARKRPRKRLNEVERLRRAIADHPLTQIASAMFPRSALLVETVLPAAAAAAAETVQTKSAALDAKLEQSILERLGIK